MTEPKVRVMAERCKTCVFSASTPIPPERFRELFETWSARGAETYQVCHQTGTWNVDDPDDGPPLDREIAVCRGFFDEMYVKRGLPVQLLQIAERLNFIDLEFRP